MHAHVFIVNDGTLPSHLRYLFAGTGARDKDENVALAADIARVRPGDLVLFYIEARANVKGGFYGVFKVADQDPLVFHVMGEDASEPELEKKLIYRTLIEPHEVYSKGVGEFEALDKLPVYAAQLQWSLIYRKLKGGRGCTPLLPWEAQSLIDLIRNKNSGRPIADAGSAHGFSLDISSRTITTTEARQAYPYARGFAFNVLESICEKQQRKRAYETELQLYFTQNIGIEAGLDSIVGEDMTWFGNEVACGVGMQKMDILAIRGQAERTEYRIVELKDEPAQPEVVEQVEYYANWASQDAGRHLPGAFAWNIQPVVVAPPHDRTERPLLVDAFVGYNEKGISLPVLYFEFQVDCGKSIAFEQIEY